VIGDGNGHPTRTKDLILSPPQCPTLAVLLSMSMVPEEMAY
jgi:hypothetical protein